MIARAIRLAALLLALPLAAHAGACPAGTEMVLNGITLPRVQEAVTAGRRLSILAVGGSATSGAAAGGESHAYPARLAERLGEALPGVDVGIASRAAIRRSARAMVQRLDRDLAETKPDLVIWGVGGLEAGRHVDIDTFTDTLQRGIAAVQAAKADLILMDVMYAPSIARLIDLTPYRDATAATASAHDVPMLDRHGLMRDWSEAGAIDLDATSPEARTAVARRLFDCFAAILADGIISAVQRK
jgi:hypothetical protein